MQLTLAIAAAFGLLAAAAPAAAPATGSLAKRDGAQDAGIVYMCNDKKSKGNCQAQDFALGKCTPFSNGYAGTTKTVQNLSHNVKCTWYLTDDCTGDSYDNQNDQDLTDGNGKFANMRSGNCAAS